MPNWPDEFSPLRFISVLMLLVLGLAGLVATAQEADTDREDLSFEIRQRVTAHGNEFNGVAKSSDGKRLFIATEKGDILIWNIATRRVERTLHQPSPVHFVAALADTNEILATGANHHKPVNAVARKWNVETGAFVDLAGLDENSFPTALTTAGGLVAVTTAERDVVIWDVGTHKQVATWKLKETPLAIALLGRTAYVATVDQETIRSKLGSGESVISKLNIDDPKQAPSEFRRIRDHLWAALDVSPDQRFLSATSERFGNGTTLILDPTSNAEIGKFEGAASIWIDKSRLMLFDWLDPSEIVEVPANGAAVSIRKLERMKSDTHGRAFELSGQVMASDGSKIWATYRKGPGLLEFDLASNKMTTFIQGPSGAYGVSVVTRNAGEGEVLTGGADGYVRLWRLADLSLIKEFHVAREGNYVSDVYLLSDGRRAVVNVKQMPKEFERIDFVEVFLLNLETGAQKKLLDLRSDHAGMALIGDEVVYPEGDRVKFISVGETQKTRELKFAAPIMTLTASANGRWLAFFDMKKKLTAFDLNTSRKRTIAIKGDPWGAWVITNDGQYVYQIAHEGQLTKWNLNTGRVSQSVLARIREMHSNVDFITLSDDDKWLVTAGNHGDVGIFDRETGRLLGYTQTSASAFYVEKVWVKRDRIIFTTDTGVMLDGKIRSNARN